MRFMTQKVMQRSPIREANMGANFIRLHGPVARYCTMIIIGFSAVVPLTSLAQGKEPWILKPRGEWPQIALTNHVQFKNGDRFIHPSFSYAGTGFLVNSGKDTLAATAKHVLWVARNKNSMMVEINDDLKEWTMKRKGDSDDVVIIDRLLNEDSTEVLHASGSTILERDWLVFSVKKTSPGIYPLKPRYTPIRHGEKVYVASCAYKDSTCVIYDGRVLKKIGMDILIQLTTTDLNLGGYSGSPVIDANGYLIGIISSNSTEGRTGKNVSVAVSTEYLYKVINGVKGYNEPKKDYGQLILDTVLKQGAKAAIRRYREIERNPDNYYTYNFRSADRNGLRETGEKLLEMKRINDAIEILKLNLQENTAFFGNYNLLARAYAMAGNKVEAIKYYQLSTTKYDDKNDNEAFKELEKLISDK
jgi:hypothetical protein